MSAWGSLGVYSSVKSAGNTAGNSALATAQAQKLPALWRRVAHHAATNILSDKAIKAVIKAAHATAKASKPNDGARLSLETRATGVGWWRLRYRLDSRERMRRVGTSPETGLRDARIKRDAARKLVAAGGDPSQTRKDDKAERLDARKAQALADAGQPGPGTFEFVAREWLTTQHEAKVTPSHAQRTRIRLEQDAFPWLGRRPLGEMEAPELLQCLRRVEARGAIETAHRIKDACGQVFRYGVAIGACQRNPAADLRDALKPVQTRHHAAIVDPTQTGALLRARSGRIQPAKRPRAERLLAKASGTKAGTAFLACGALHATSACCEA
jgi:Arm DNA-binding domain